MAERTEKEESTRQTGAGGLRPGGRGRRGGGRGDGHPRQLIIRRTVSSSTTGLTAPEAGAGSDRAMATLIGLTGIQPKVWGGGESTYYSPPLGSCLFVRNRVRKDGYLQAC